MFWSVIGTSAAVLTMLSFIPQIIKALKTKSVKDVSTVTLLQFSLGALLWIIYGIHLENAIIIMANIVTLISLIILLFLYMFFHRTKNEKLF